MSYEIRGSNGRYWTCNQLDWRYYLDIATLFGWAREGALFKCDEGGYGEHPSGSYLGNDWQIVTDDDARAMAAALNRAIFKIDAGDLMTDEQATALNALAADCYDPLSSADLTELHRAFLLKTRNENLAAHPDEFRTIRASRGFFECNIRGLMDLADVASAGKFIIL